MRRKLLACTAMLCAILFSLTVVHAAVTPHATPYAGLDFSGTTATCSVRKDHQGHHAALAGEYPGGLLERLRHIHAAPFGDPQRNQRQDLHRARYLHRKRQQLRRQPHNQNLPVSNPQQ